MINHDETTPTQRGGVCSSTGALGTTPPASGSLGPPGLAGVLGGGRGIITGAPSPHQLSRQGSSVESHASSVPIHYHTAECSATGRSLHQPTHHSKVRPFCGRNEGINYNNVFFSIEWLTISFFNISVAHQHPMNVTSTVAHCMRVI